MEENETLVTVDRVWSDGGTTAVGSGFDDEGRYVTFGGDWRPMRDLSLALDVARNTGGDLPVASVPDWAVLGVS